MKSDYDKRSFLIHPSALILILILVGISALFGALSFAYMYTRIDKDMMSIRLPWVFVVNTFILAASSVFIHQCFLSFDKKNEKRLLRFGMLALVATLLFLIMQVIGWNHLFTKQIVPGTSGGFGYLYAISILHFLHVIAGLPFLIRILLPVYTSYKEGNSSLFFIDERNRRRLRHTAWYWHFIDVIWIYLVVFFVVNSLV